MIQYHFSALALKGFSCCEPARSHYRALDNMPSYPTSIARAAGRQR